METSQTQETPAPAQESAPVKLDLNDLNAAVKIIDACAQRGAFKGNELATVGTVRDRIEAFVKANTPAEETKPEGETAPAEQQPAPATT